jgi:hypothetical protein
MSTAMPARPAPRTTIAPVLTPPVPKTLTEANAIITVLLQQLSDAARANGELCSLIMMLRGQVYARDQLLGRRPNESELEGQERPAKRHKAVEMIDAMSAAAQLSILADAAPLPTETDEKKEDPALARVLTAELRAKAREIADSKELSAAVGLLPAPSAPATTEHLIMALASLPTSLPSYEFDRTVHSARGGSAGLASATSTRQFLTKRDLLVQQRDGRIRLPEPDVLAHAAAESVVEQGLIAAVRQRAQELFASGQYSQDIAVSRKKAGTVPISYYVLAYLEHLKAPVIYRDFEGLVSVAAGCGQVGTDHAIASLRKKELVKIDERRLVQGIPVWHVLPSERS